ncbi:MAG: HAD family hydrolase [Chromatiales bacterium]|jgi:putative hydrolase of the HAD superfamily
MDIRCITFDLDDTLWAIAPVIMRAEQRVYDWLDRHYPLITAGHSLQTLIEQRTAYMREYPDLHHDLTRLRKQWLGHVAEAAGYEPALAEPAFEVFWEARNQVEVFPEALDALDALGSVYRIGAITNGNADVHRIGIGHHFDFVLYAAGVGAAKPHRDIFLAALEHTGLDAAEVVHVGDDPACDVMGAAAVGMRTVWVNSAGRDWDGPGMEPDAVISGLGELEAVLSGWAG